MYTNDYGDQTGSSQTTERNKGCDLRWNMHRQQKARKKSARQTKEAKKRTNEHANPTIKLHKIIGHESGQKKKRKLLTPSAKEERKTKFK